MAEKSTRAPQSHGRGASVRLGFDSVSVLGRTLGWYLRKGALGASFRGIFRFGLSRARGPVLLGRRTKVLYGSRISLGRFVYIGANGFINALAEEGVMLGDRVTIRENAWIQCASSPTRPGRSLRIGAGTYIGPYAVIGVSAPVIIGADCQVGAGVVLVAENHDVDADGRVSATEVVRKGIEIGDGCWLGHRVTILDGVRLGSDCIVGAGAVVTRSFPSGSRIAGVPARLI